MGLQHKFRAVAVVRDGIRFDSKLEARLYDVLKIQQAMGVVVTFLRQVPVHLPGGVLMRVDFQVFYASGEVRFLDAKGVETEAWTAKRTIAEALYPFKIETWTDK